MERHRLSITNAEADSILSSAVGATARDTALIPSVEDFLDGRQEGQCQCHCHYVGGRSHTEICDVTCDNWEGE